MTNAPTEFPTHGVHSDKQHPPMLAHHFHSPKQQFDAGKLGMWLFILTEVLFFGGLFCAYAVYRTIHPEIFIYAHQFLDKNLGALNTAVLIASSLSIAWAVRCAQCNQHRGLIACLAITLALATMFLGVKYVEYKQKWEHGLLWAGEYRADTSAATEHSDTSARSRIRQNSGGFSSPRPKSGDFGYDSSVPQSAHGSASGPPRNVGIFFSIYFAMTGLHGIHVLAGMGVMVWVLVGAVRGRFSSEYFAPVDYTALYWHLVDMIWIYLFPLLYLIQ